MKVRKSNLFRSAFIKRTLESESKEKLMIGQPSFVSDRPGISQTFLIAVLSSETSKPVSLTLPAPFRVSVRERVYKLRTTKVIANTRFPQIDTKDGFDGKTGRLDGDRAFAHKSAALFRLCPHAQQYD